MEEITAEKDHVDLVSVRQIHGSGLACSQGLTSWVFANFMISSNVCQLSSFRMGSRSSYPTWLSVATRIRIVSSPEQTQDQQAICEWGHQAETASLRTQSVRSHLDRSSGLLLPRNCTRVQENYDVCIVLSGQRERLKWRWRVSRRREGIKEGITG